MLHLNGVDAGLIQEEFVNRHLFRDDAIRIAVDGNALHQRLLVLFLDIALENGFITDYPRNFLCYIVLCHHGQDGHDQCQCCKKSQFHLYRRFGLFQTAKLLKVLCRTKCIDKIFVKTRGKMEFMYSEQ